MKPEGFRDRIVGQAMLGSKRMIKTREAVEECAGPRHVEWTDRRDSTRWGQMAVIET